MNKEEAKHLLIGFQFNVIEYGEMLQVIEEQHKKSTEITVDQIYAALQYQGDKRNIRQIDPWTIIIAF